MKLKILKLLKVTTLNYNHKLQNSNINCGMGTSLK